MEKDERGIYKVAVAGLICALISVSFVFFKKQVNCADTFILESEAEVKEWIEWNIECKNTETTRSAFSGCEEPSVRKNGENWNIFCAQNAGSVEATVDINGTFISQPIYTESF